MIAAYHALRCDISRTNSQNDDDERLAIVAAALHSWRIPNEGAKALPTSAPCLNDRKKVLDHHLQHRVATHDGASLWSSTWQQVLETCGN